MVTWVAAVMETTKLGTEEQERLTLLPSASSTILLPLGQMTWSTWDQGQARQHLSSSTSEEDQQAGLTWLRTFSHTSSWVFRLSTSISVLLWPMLHTMHPFFILSMLSLVTTFLLPVAVMTMSTFCTTSASLTTWRNRWERRRV